jgi:hypothetical protein
LQQNISQKICDVFHIFCALGADLNLGKTIGLWRYISGSAGALGGSGQKVRFHA